MRHFPAILLLAVLPALGAGLTACDDNSAFAEPRIISDTIALAIPQADTVLPTAIDLVRVQPPYTLRRFPEQFGDAQQWDLALRREEGGGLALLPYSVPGSGSRGAGIAPAASDFDALSRAPRGTAAYQYGTLPITAGTTYVVRSRQYSGGFSGACVKYAKLKVLTADVPAGMATVAVAVNENCEDERLTD